MDGRVAFSSFMALGPLCEYLKVVPLWGHFSVPERRSLFLEDVWLPHSVPALELYRSSLWVVPETGEVYVAATALPCICYSLSTCIRTFSLPQVIFICFTSGWNFSKNLLLNISEFLKCLGPQWHWSIHSSVRVLGPCKKCSLFHQFISKPSAQVSA